MGMEFSSYKEMRSPLRVDGLFMNLKTKRAGGRRLDMKKIIAYMAAGSFFSDSSYSLWGDNKHDRERIPE